jgi:RecA-family ATPase
MIDALLKLGRRKPTLRPQPISEATRQLIDQYAGISNETLQAEYDALLKQRPVELQGMNTQDYIHALEQWGKTLIPIGQEINRRISAGEWTE